MFPFSVRSLLNPIKRFTFSDTVNVNLLNAHPRDSQLQFDKKLHQYRVKNTIYDSVTTIIDRMGDQFDPNRIIRFLRIRDEANILKNKPVSRYHELSDEQIISEWNKSKDDGSNCHKLFELSLLNNYNDEFYKLIEKYPYEFRTFQKLQIKFQHLNLYRTEWAVYDEEFLLAGTMDSVYKLDGKMYIYDWKRIKRVTKDKNGNFNKFKLQLNLYKYILEKNYEIQVENIAFVGIHENSSYKSFDIQYVPVMDKEEIELMLVKHLKPELIVK
eukprot:NODE_31_length_37178_cov_0.413576.p14 type:complete len:271 gc:universal NODE_31_length_37178_cov_0.413576:20183-20995(+)